MRVYCAVYDGIPDTPVVGDLLMENQAALSVFPARNR
ncbi:hypothetical protein CT19431_P80019 [Cupriavidus taiwanensis]|nr:hypothetical protein CT19431_P80019 [Cupriavidus taiwanensis]